MTVGLILHPAVEKQWWNSQYKGVFLPLQQGYITTASLLDQWIGVDPYSQKITLVK